MSNLKTAILYLWQLTISKIKPVLHRAVRPLRLQSVQGQAMVEYALLIALIALVVLGILVLLGPQVGSVFSGVTTTVSGNCADPSGVDQRCIQPLNNYPTPFP